jgi:CubicO group peptidase (beta-lactamase class C family)
MGRLDELVERVAREHDFSGAVRVDRGNEIELARAYGLANRAHGIANTTETRFAIASGSKGLTALAVVSLIEEGTLELSTTARSVLGDDLPLVGEGVTVEHLLAHRSGIGDYLDEDDERPITDHLMPVPVHELDTTQSYLAILDGHPAKFAPDERFAYCNGGYVVLALIAERTSGIPFHELVPLRVCEPAGMENTAFLRSDELPGNAATGYLSADPGSRTNVLHLPVVGSGDGGMYSTVADVHAFWTALFAGQIVSEHWVAEMVRPRSDVPSGSLRYGLGFWLHASGSRVQLEGYDAGVSFRTEFDPDAEIGYTVVSNTSEGAWPLSRSLREHLWLTAAPTGPARTIPA